MRKFRAAAKTHVAYKDAMKTADILSGSLIIAELHMTDDNIGLMTEECLHCGALKFPKETPSRVVRLP